MKYNLLSLVLVLAPWPALAGDLPDSSLTPGATLPVILAALCQSGYTKTVRDVPQSEKNAIYAEYGVVSHKPYEYEIDHLISLELGGSNDPKNLWPQSYVTKPWNAHVKDKLENKLHLEVCASRLSLSAAQGMISVDWEKAYIAYFGAP